MFFLSLSKKEKEKDKKNIKTKQKAHVKRRVYCCCPSPHKRGARPKCAWNTQGHSTGEN